MKQGRLSSRAVSVWMKNFDALSPSTLAPKLGQIEKWPISFLHLLMCFVPFATLPLRSISRSWSHACDNNCGMVIRYSRHLRRGLDKYIALLMTGCATRIQPKSLRVLRLHIDTFKSCTKHRLFTFIKNLKPIRQFSLMTSLYLAFDLDFYVDDHLANAVASILPIRIVTLELHFHCKCIFTSAGVFAITNVICEMTNIRNMILWFSGYRKGVYYPGGQPMKECYQKILKELKHILNQRIYCNSKLIHTGLWTHTYFQDALAGMAFRDVNLFPTV